MAAPRPTKLDPAVDPARDHVLGDPGAKMVLVEYGSYACPSCHTAHQVVRNLWRHFGDRMLYAFRQRPIGGSNEAERPPCWPNTPPRRTTASGRSMRR